MENKTKNKHKVHASNSTRQAGETAVDVCH